MIKRSALALMTLATFATSSAFAHDKACCATTAGTGNMKQECEASFANLKLSAAQQAKMRKLAAECDKSGCDKQAMAKMEKSAKGILSKDQFTTWKANCSGAMTSHKTQS